MPGPASSVEECLLCNILRLKGPWFKTRHTPGFFHAVAKINAQPQILEKCGESPNLDYWNRRKLSERKHIPNKLVL